MIRSTLSTLVNTTIGRVRRRTSTKQRSITLAGGRALIPKNDFGWPILAGLFLARVMGSFSCPFASFHLAAPGCRLGTRGGNLHSRILSALRPGNFQLFADGPHSSFLDFTMARDAGYLVQRRVEPNTVGSTLAIQNATVLAQMAFQFREFHASAISITSRTACGERPFSASSRWHCSASLSASARFALASSMVSPCEIAAGISSTKQVYPPSLAGSKTAVNFMPLDYHTRPLRWWLPRGSGLAGPGKEGTSLPEARASRARRRAASSAAVKRRSR